MEVYVYGEGQTNDKAKNLRGQVYKIYDGAGVAETPDYDFKGNPLIQKRTYTEDATQHPDWTSIGSVNLETETYDTATEYDTLNRPVKLTTPDDGETKYTYDKGGLLKTVEVENVHSLDTEIVNNIEYDTKGQRTKVQHENGTTTSYEYDEFTFRVRRIRTTRHSDSKELQDLRYWYDPVGNVTLQKDLAQQTVYFDGSVADAKNDYTYDALYRLIQVEGREHAGNNTAPNYNDNGRVGITPVPIASTDTAKMRRYTQHYEYDEVGNFITMQHTVAGGTGNWTRYYTTANNSNRLQSTKIGTSGTPETYTYDNRGNIVSGFIHLQSLTYNAENRLEKVEIDANRTAYYQYDNAGQRVKKTIVDTNSNITEVRKYIGEWEVYSKSVSSTLTLERETLHISDDTGRIALIDTRTTGTGAEPAQLLRYQYSNHLGTATLELDGAGAIISYEEYFSYGSTSFQSGRSLAEVSLKKFRYCNSERDEESGLYSMGRRYYIPWLARWSAVDMLQGDMPTWSPYNYGFCNPVKWTDKSGMQPEEKDPPKSLIEGEAVAYTTVINTYDHNNILIEIQSETKFVPIEELPPDSIRGEYIRNIYLPDPNKTTIKDGNLKVSNIGYQTNEFIPYNFSSDEKLMEYPSSQGESFLESAWNSTLARAMVPDKISFSIGADFAYGGGGGVHPTNITILTRGKDPGVYITPSYNFTAGITAKAEGSINFSTGYYTGNPRDIQASMLLGVNHAVNISVKALAGISFGVSYSNTDDDYKFINKNVGIGVGVGFSLEYQRQITPTYGPFLQWKNK
ncbi:RHS repeat protein [Sphingobacterium humi]|uniref:RHS repeat-associated core domain-containing protein n=1 Tax=Sphingobacterium humi TaxID=1796905 RepID=A0A6N8L419_9SPHI|nr:RHS repeat protein [Sphingobacterium humi]MVZ63769.1 hypothetical protein [Sphingobacterium humi]